MKITTFQTQLVHLPNERGLLGEIPGRVDPTFVTLRVRTDEGIEGISYAGYAGYTAGMARALQATVEALLEQAIGRDPFETDAIGAQLRTANGGASPAGLVTRASSAIDVALWDIKGKAVGLPCWKLMGGNSNRVRAYGSGHLWRHYSLAELAEWAPRLVDAGFRAVKLRCGGESVANDVERMRVVREAVGPDVEIKVDVNQLPTVHDALRLARALERYELSWFEDPTHFQDFAGQARIADALDTPVCSGEYHYGLAPFRQLLESRSVDIVMPDLFRVGGFTQFLKVAHLAEAFNLPVASHLATELFVHAMAAIPNGLTTEHVAWTNSLFKEVPRIEPGGWLAIPDGPGLGLEFDDERIAKMA